MQVHLGENKKMDRCMGAWLGPVKIAVAVVHCRAGRAGSGMNCQYFGTTFSFGLCTQSCESLYHCIKVHTCNYKCQYLGKELLYNLRLAPFHLPGRVTAAQLVHMSPIVQNIVS